MHTFNDNLGRTWTVSINVTAIKRVQGLLNVNLYKLIDNGFKKLAELMHDIIQLVDVIYCLCKDEADTRQVSAEDFGRAMAGDAIHHATDAFLQELIDFFPDPRARRNLHRLVAESQKVRDRLLGHAETVLETFDVDREADRLLHSYGIAPVSSDSTPAHSRSEN